MKTEKTKTESLEEIVFRHRNRAYGACQLRREYRKYVTIALIIALFIATGAVSYPLVTAMYAKPSNDIIAEIGVDVELDKPPADEPTKTPPPPPPESVKEEIRFVPPVVVDTAVESNQFVQSLLADKPNTELPDEHPVITIEEDKPQVIEQPVVEDTWTFVQLMPEFPGGESALKSYLATLIKYPENAKELGIQGVVYINFVVEKDGSITEVKVLRGIGGGCDEEALKVVMGMPKWNPGRQQGTLVRVSFNLPVRFTLR